jgi:RNA polymerase sigma factor (sigma-70 family)
LEQAIHILTAIVEKAKQGNQDARASLYQQFASKMFSICIRMTGNPPDAEDLLQESFLLAFNHLRKLQQQHLFEPWLRSIVVRQCIRHTKKVTPWQPINEEHTAQPDDGSIGWLEGISFEQIHLAISQLPAGCREVFNLYVLEDYSHQQIADSLSISVSTSKSQYHRARQLLKERLLKQVTYG